MGDRLSWRRFVGLGLQDAVPDETTLVNYRKRLRAFGQQDKLLALVNRHIEAGNAANGAGGTASPTGFWSSPAAARNCGRRRCG